jgi:hypothetical protein
MGQLSARQFVMDVSTRGFESHTREWLYKGDRPRGIDRYIDFFGDGLSRAQADADGCGEIFLESLA